MYVECECVRLCARFFIQMHFFPFSLSVHILCCLQAVCSRFIRIFCCCWCCFFFVCPQTGMGNHIFILVVVFLVLFSIFSSLSHVRFFLFRCPSARAGDVFAIEPEMRCEWIRSLLAHVCVCVFSLCIHFIRCSVFHFASAALCFSNDPKRLQ